jgi:hypothetical protein
MLAAIQQGGQIKMKGSENYCELCNEVMDPTPF